MHTHLLLETGPAQDFAGPWGKIITRAPTSKKNPFVIFPNNHHRRRYSFEKYFL